MPDYRFQIDKRFQEIMKQNAEYMAKVYEPMLKFQNPPIVKELQKTIQGFTKIADEISLKNQEAFNRLVDLHNHTGLKAFSEQMELIGKQLTGKLAIDLVSPVLKDLQASLDGLDISDEKFQKALNRLQDRDFVDEFEKKVSNLEKGHSTSQGIQIGISEVLAFLMFLLMFFQTLDNSTDKALEQLNEGQEITNKLLERLIELNTSSDELVNQSKNNQFKLLITNESVPLFANPSTDSDTLITLFKGQHLDHLEEKGDWYKVQIYDKSTSENEIGWVQKKYIIPEIELGQAISKKLGDIASSSKGKKPDLIETSPDDGLIPYVDIQGFEEREFRKYTDGKGCRLCEEGDLLMVWDGSRSGLVGKAPAGAIGSTLAKIELDGITNEYGYYFLKSHYQYLNTNPKGSGTPHVDPDLLWNLDIRVPTIEEQHRIVEKIEELFSELDNGVENLKKAQKQLKTYRQAVLKDAFEGKLTKEWREQQDDLPTPEELLQQIKAERKAHRQHELAEWEKEVEQWEKDGEKGKKPTKPRKSRSVDKLTEDELSELHDLPENWVWGKINDITLRVEYGTSNKSLDEGDIPVLRMGNMQNGKIDWSDLKYSNEVKDNEEYLLQEEDVLFNRTNSPELVGKSVIYKGERPAIFAGYLIRLNQIREVMNGYYLNYFLNSVTAKNHGNTVKTDGVNQSNINGTKLVNYPIPLCSKKEQDQIVQEIESRLSVIDQLEQTIKENLQKAEALRRSILKKAFSGELVEE